MSLFVQDLVLIADLLDVAMKMMSLAKSWSQLLLSPASVIRTATHSMTVVMM